MTKAHLKCFPLCGIVWKFPSRRSVRVNIFSQKWFISGFISFGRLIRSGWNVPRLLYINSCFQSHTHTHTHEEVTKNLSETSMEFFKETTGNFFGSSNVVPFSVGWLHRSESTLALLGTVSISVQPFVLFLNSIFRSYIPPFWILFSSCYHFFILLFRPLYCWWLSKKRQTNKLLGLPEIRLLRK